MSTDHNLNKDSQENNLRETLAVKLTNEIESNLKNDQFGVDNLAQAVGMSRSNLHRKLNKLLNTSTSRFIREYRLKRALEILRQEDITASEASYRVGFSSPTYFNTCFHKFYGFTPGEVKSINNIELKRPISDESADVVKSNAKKKLLWVLFLIPVLVIGVFYFRSSNKVENKEAKKSEFIIDEKSIAVIPFKNWTGNPDLEYISDGMTDAVISRLTKINAIEKVIPFTSALPYKRTEKSIEEIAKELGVENLLQGNLQISGNQIKINLQLIHGSSNVHLWSEEYMREWKSDEIFKIQSEVVEAVAKNMKATISKDEMMVIKKIPTKNKQAYSYYLQADFQRNKASELSYSNAISFYEKAIALDSSFVQPYLDMANIYNLGGGVWGSYDERMAWQKAKKLLEKVLEIEPANQQAEEELHTGNFFYDWNFELVENYYQSILESSFYDKSPVVSLDYAIKTGRSKEALKASEYFILNDPSSAFFPFFKAESLFFLGSKDEAIKMLNYSDPFYSDNWFYLRESAKLYFYLEEHEKSKIQLEKIVSHFSDYPPILMWLNLVHAQIEKDSENTSRYLTELYKSYYEGSSGSPAWFIALYYAHIKNNEKSLEWLQKSYDKHEVEMTWLREEPLLAPLRNNLQYQDLYNKVGFSSIGLPIKLSSE